MSKKNFRRTPERITNKVNQLSEQNLTVSCLLTYSANEIRNGNLNHLGISLDNSGLHLPTSIIPNEKQGKHSYENINGKEIIRRDLPKTLKYFTIEVPNWGDSSKGTHDVNIPRMVYQRDFISPHLVSIEMECQNTAPGQSAYGILFRLDEVLDKNSPDFNERLFDLINILQENVYSCDIYAATSNYQEYISTVALAWEILPPGEREAFIQRVSNGSTNPQQNRIIEERYNFLISLRPVNLIVGFSGLQRYLGAKLSDNLVVFENTTYGNAIYIMYDNWESLSQLSRTQLLSGRFGNNFDRVLHKNGWEDKVRRIITSRLFRQTA
jgi:hypothetical protein